MSSRASACRCRSSRATSSAGGDADVDLPRAGVADHPDDLAAGGAADDRVVDDHDALALEDRLVRVQLQPDAEVADRLLRLDERAPDVVAADEAQLEGRRPRCSAKPIAAGTPESGTGITTTSALGGAAPRASCGRGPCAPRRRSRLERRVGAGEVDVLEEARAAALRSRSGRTRCGCRSRRR